MGVTIHFEGRLKNQEALVRVVELARRYSATEGWRLESLDRDDATLKRVRDEEDWDYQGPVRGIELWVHDDADALRLEFDRDLYVQEFIKTQFAPLTVHKRVVGFLRAIEPEFDGLVVDDEGEFWGTGDHDVLPGHIDACNRVLAEYLAEHPGARGPVRLDDGRIVDVMS